MTDLADRLERALHAGSPAALPADRLRAIRSEGRRRRARQRALTVTGAVLAVVLVGGVPAALVAGQDDSAPAPAAPSPSRSEDPEATDQPITASPDLPGDLAALQERILAEVPGAVRSSPTQVDLPDPRVADPDLQPPASGYDRVEGAFGLGVDHYVTPSGFATDTFPRWLWRAWTEFQDRANAGDADLRALAGGGVRVAAGEWRIGCDPGVAIEGCRPVLLSRSGVSYVLERPTGPGGVAVTRPDQYARGGAPSLAVALVRRGDVTSARFVTSDGESVEGAVDTTLAPGRSIVWAAVPGTVDTVVVDGEDPVR
ncbi:hypothetical protein [Nocardioides sp. CFH 31398]|uniref:hypothetical protein n=1 Tax=Nocardioides sp. CFH 31398 TaxID=2919579 RepID=UPI001F050C87|nr:hypothetical protein [Nocardioides sp. CFH 31398]MCH1866388.1 hypothetical protein [Nocardioides sp. CFH 31398]